jgi:hypothetical protein
VAMGLVGPGWILTGSSQHASCQTGVVSRLVTGKLTHYPNFPICAIGACDLSAATVPAPGELGRHAPAL